MDHLDHPIPFKMGANYESLSKTKWLKNNDDKLK